MPFRYIAYVLFLLIPLAVTVLTGVVVSWTWFILILVPPVEIGFLFIRLRRQRMVSALVRTAMESGVPIHEVLESYAVDGTGPWYREKVMNFAFELRQGHSVIEAARRFPGVLRYDIAALIGLGGTIGPDEYDSLQVDGEKRHVDGAKARSMLQASWVYGYLPATLILTSWFLWAIVPKFQAIFNDFGMDVPLVTRLLVSGANYALHYWPVVGLFLLFFILFPLLYFVIRSGFFPWRPPGLRRILRRLDSARFLRILSLGWTRRRTFPEIVDAYVFTANSFYLKDCARRFLADIEAGVDWIAALRRRGWIDRAEAALLDSAARSDNVAAMLREIAAARDLQQTNSDLLALRLFSLLLLIILGALVGFIAIAIFYPLVSLIVSLTLAI